METRRSWLSVWKREMDPRDTRGGGCRHWGSKEVSLEVSGDPAGERFKSDVSQIRHATRLELGCYDELAAEMFALVVFVSDGLLQVNDTTASPAARFFSIVAQLPLELQMVLCFRLVGSAKEIIPGKETEVAFKSLARKLW